MKNVKLFIPWGRWERSPATGAIVSQRKSLQGKKTIYCLYTYSHCLSLSVVSISSVSPVNYTLHILLIRTFFWYGWSKGGGLLGNVLNITTIRFQCLILERFHAKRHWDKLRTTSLVTNRITCFPIIKYAEDSPEPHTHCRHHATNTNGSPPACAAVSMCAECRCVWLWEACRWCSSDASVGIFKFSVRKRCMQPPCRTYNQ